MSYTKSQLQHQKELEVARERIRNRKKKNAAIDSVRSNRRVFFPRFRSADAGRISESFILPSFPVRALQSSGRGSGHKPS